MNRRGFFSFLAAAAAAAAAGFGRRAALASGGVASAPSPLMVGEVPSEFLGPPGFAKVTYSRLKVLEDGAERLRLFGSAIEPLGRVADDELIP
jgi:hypothetical protein